MSYVTENLMPGEKVVHQAKLHWIIFVTPILFLVLGFLLLSDPELAGGGPFFIVLAALVGLARAITYTTSEFAVTDKRVLVKVGLIRRRSLELNLVKVEGIQVDQGIVGRLLDYGTIVVRGTGGTREPFKSIADPMAFRLAVQNQTHAAMPTAFETTR